MYVSQSNPSWQSHANGSLRSARYGSQYSARCCRYRFELKRPIWRYRKLSCATEKQYTNADSTTDSIPTGGMVATRWRELLFENEIGFALYRCAADGLVAQTQVGERAGWVHLVPFSRLHGRFCCWSCCYCFVASNWWVFFASLLRQLWFGIEVLGCGWGLVLYNCFLSFFFGTISLGFLRKRKWKRVDEKKTFTFWIINARSLHSGANRETETFLDSINISSILFATRRSQPLEQMLLCQMVPVLKKSVHQRSSIFGGCFNQNLPFLFVALIDGKSLSKFFWGDTSGIKLHFFIQILVLLLFHNMTTTIPVCTVMANRSTLPEQVNDHPGEWENGKSRIQQDAELLIPPRQTLNQKMFSMLPF